MRPDRILFVTGTDSGVGKTFVGAALARAAAMSGRSVIGVKLVETGCGGAIRRDEDGAILATATGQSSPRAALNRLARSTDPPVAAEAEDVHLSMDVWLATVERLSDVADLVVVEGTGGILSPMTWSSTLRDMVTSTGARALIVAADRAGTLNHALLSLEALGRSALGVVLSAPARPDASTGSIHAALARLAPGVRILSIPRLETFAQAAPHVEPILAWMAG